VRGALRGRLGSDALTLDVEFSSYRLRDKSGVDPNDECDDSRVGSLISGLCEPGASATGNVACFSLEIQYRERSFANGVRVHAKPDATE
jgi:hypothetical protein